MPPRVKESSWHFWCVFYKECILNKPGRLTQDPLIPAYIFVKETLKTPAKKQVWVNPSPWKKKTPKNISDQIGWCTFRFFLQKPLGGGQTDSGAVPQPTGAVALLPQQQPGTAEQDAVPSQICRVLWVPWVTPQLPSIPNMLPTCHLAEEAMGSWEQLVWQENISHPSGSSLTGKLAKMNRYLWSELTEIN